MVLLDIGLATIFVCGMLLAAFIATAVISREIERKTVLTVVPYYLDRNAGKKFGQLFQFRPYTATGPLSFDLPRDID